ncbi:glycosyltransferase [Pedobacter fastidiosus]|uniref:glycosyltransferase n=1 Tax=Pedobacter fastidiosus TaxID=2765361 RepID=UPI00164E4E34|nr:glycosyltransferase [Pedobacter fastidiosus]
MDNPKKLLFVHDRLPAEGISGMIVFLRHFLRLQNWEIHILIPENASNIEVINGYPKNFFVHTFKLRRRLWPPFREHNSFLVNVRLFLLEKAFRKIVNRIKPDVTISVLYHYYSVVMANLCNRIKIPFVLFLHDRWDDKTKKLKAQQSRLYYGEKTIKKSDYIFSVTDNLVKLYLQDLNANYEVLPPIPEGYTTPIPLKKKDTLLYAGSVDQHHVRLFDQILPVLKANNYTLVVLTNELEKLDDLKNKHQNLDLKKSLPTNREALAFIASNASAILVNYGISEAENPDSLYSFPSKFIEYIHLEIPIITLTPENSPFYKFLKENKWPLILEGPIVENMSIQLGLIKDKLALDNFENIQKELVDNQYNPFQIQKRFELVLEQLLEQKTN